jgi:hypothetical protein
VATLLVLFSFRPSDSKCEELKMNSHYVDTEMLLMPLLMMSICQKTAHGGEGKKSYRL